MRSWMIAYLAGVMMFHLWGQLVPATYAIVLAVSSLLIFVIFKRFRWLSFLLLSVVWSSVYSELNKRELIDTSVERVDLVSTGFICSIPKQKKRLIAFELCDASIRLPGSETVSATGLHLKLNWYTSEPHSLSGKHSFVVSLKKPHGMVNPHGFLYEKWLFRKGIDGVGYVKRPIVESGNNHCDRLAVSCWITVSRIRLNEYLNRLSPQLDHLPIIKALSIGFRGDIDAKSWDLLKNTGTQHLIAISGLHVGLVFGSILLLMSLCWKLFKPVVPRRMYEKFLRHKSIVNVFAALLGALIYSGLAGFSVSTQRALIMLLVFSISGIFRYRLTANTRLLMAATFVLAIDPNGVLDYGFWLSFAAVWVLFTGVPTAVKLSGVDRFGRIKSFLRMQWVVTIGLCPLLLTVGLGVSYTSMLANIVAIPLVGFFTVPVLLVGVVASSVSYSISEIFLNVADISIALLLYYLNLFASFSTVEIPIATVMIIAIALLSLAILIVPVWRIFSLWVVAVVSVLLLFRLSIHSNDDVEIVVFDVGQGLSVAAVKGTNSFVYDTGPAYLSGNAASRSLIPYLEAKGVKNIETLVVSHGDNDHSGGLADIEEVFHVATIVSGEVDRLKTRNPVHRCEDGMVVTSSWYKAMFYYVPGFPIHDFRDKELAKNQYSANNHSCVVKLEIEGYSILLMGDVEKHAERLLVDRYRSELGSNVLVAGHHGSRNATSRYLLDNVRPETVVFSSGYKNRFNHPHPDTVKRVLERNVRVFNTASEGAIVVSKNEDGIWYGKSERDKLNKFWLF